MWVQIMEGQLAEQLTLGSRKAYDLALKGD